MKLIKVWPIMLARKHYFHVAFICHRCALAGSKGVISKLSLDKSLSVDGMLVSFTGLLGVSAGRCFKSDHETGVQITQSTHLMCASITPNSFSSSHLCSFWASRLY